MLSAAQYVLLCVPAQTSDTEPKHRMLGSVSLTAFCYMVGAMLSTVDTKMDYTQSMP